jgi:REP element-mobilizing transposase RayT
VVNGKMMKNKYGNLVEYTWNDLIIHNQHIQLDEFIVMPDHIHGIVVINDDHGIGNSGAMIVLIHALL